MIERLSEATGAALIGNNFSLISSKFPRFISHEKKSDGPKSTKHENLVDSWTESVSQEW